MEIGSQSTLNDLQELAKRVNEIEPYDRDDVLSEKNIIGANGGVYDFDSVIESGFYTVHRANGEFGSTAVLNRPINATGYGILICLKGKYEYISQQYITHDGYKYSRLYVGGTGWSDWAVEISTANTITDANGFIKSA